MCPRQRTYLFLQGPPSPFFQQLGQRLVDDGHRVVKLHLHPGERLFWHLGSEGVFRHPLALLPHVLMSLWRQHGITDQVLFQDSRPWHREAVLLARRYGIRNHVFEDGYLAPFWITLEREGAHQRSLLPRDPDWFREMSPRIPHMLPPRPFPGRGIGRRTFATLDRLVSLTAPMMSARRSRTSRSIGPIPSSDTPRPHKDVERHLAHKDTVWLQDGRPFFVLSPGNHLRQDLDKPDATAETHRLLESVVASFSRFAAPHCRLLILDTTSRRGSRGVRRWQRRLSRLFDLEGRLGYRSATTPEPWVSHASGWVTIDGNDAHWSLEQECPTFALGQATYCLPGLASSKGMDEFWRYPALPDTRLYHDYRRVLIYTTQINGDFYLRGGRDLAVINAVERLTGDDSPIERLLRESRAPVAS